MTIAEITEVKLTRQNTIGDLIDDLEREQAQMREQGATKPSGFQARVLSNLKANRARFESMFSNLGELADKRHTALRQVMGTEAINYITDALKKRGVIKSLSPDSTSDDVANAMLEANLPTEQQAQLTRVANALLNITAKQRKEGVKDPSAFYIGLNTNGNPRFCKNLREVKTFRRQAEYEMPRLTNLGTYSVKLMFEFIDNNLEQTKERGR